jgi:hypothetical protein
LVIERYLNEFGSLVEQKCQALIGRPLDHAVTGLVNALIESKWKRIEVARALHEPLGEVNGAKLVTRFAGKATRLVVEILRRAPMLITRAPSIRKSWAHTCARWCWGTCTRGCAPTAKRSRPPSDGAERQDIERSLPCGSEQTSALHAGR